MYTYIIDSVGDDFADRQLDARRLEAHELIMHENEKKSVGLEYKSSSKATATVVTPDGPFVFSAETARHIDSLSLEAYDTKAGELGYGASFQRMQATAGIKIESHEKNGNIRLNMAVEAKVSHPNGNSISAGIDAQRGAYLTAEICRHLDSVGIATAAPLGVAEFVHSDSVCWKGEIDTISFDKAFSHFLTGDSLDPVSKNDPIIASTVEPKDQASISHIDSAQPPDHGNSHSGHPETSAGSFHDHARHEYVSGRDYDDSHDFSHVA
jgi:hypothetical protein